MRILTALRATAAGLAVFGGGIAWFGTGLSYYDLLGPGAGFFPIWLGLMLCASSLVVLGQSFFAEDDGATLFQSSDGAVRVAVLAASLFGVWLLLDLLGFRLTILLFMLLVPNLLGRQPPLRIVAVALVMSFGVAYVFERWLGVVLPKPAIPFLETIGL